MRWEQRQERGRGQEQKNDVPHVQRLPTQSYTYTRVSFVPLSAQWQQRGGRKCKATHSTRGVHAMGGLRITRRFAAASASRCVFTAFSAGGTPRAFSTTISTHAHTPRSPAAPTPPSQSPPKQHTHRHRVVLGQFHSHFPTPLPHCQVADTDTISHLGTAVPLWTTLIPCNGLLRAKSEKKSGFAKKEERNLCLDFSLL